MGRGPGGSRSAFLRFADFHAAAAVREYRICFSGSGLVYRGTDDDTDDLGAADLDALYDTVAALEAAGTVDELAQAKAEISKKYNVIDADFEYKPLKESNGDNSQKTVKQELAFNSLILFTDIGYKISITLSAVMAVILMLAGIYTVAVFVSANPVARPHHSHHG